MHMPSRDGGDSGPNVRPPCIVILQLMTMEYEKDMKIIESPQKSTYLFTYMRHFL